MSLQEDLGDLMVRHKKMFPRLNSSSHIGRIVFVSKPGDALSFFSGLLSHLNSVLVTAFFVIAAVVAYILYIINLYDSGKLGANPAHRPVRRKYQTAGARIAEEKWMKKNL